MNRRSRGPRRREREAAHLILGMLLLGALGWGAYAWWTWPDVRALATAAPETTAFIEQAAAERRAAGETEPIRWEWVSGEQISVHLARAVVAAEDMEFFTHDGFSTAEMRFAVRDALLEGKELRGASTLTQQLAKNLWLSPSRNPLRKVREALLTRQLERHLSKPRILELYLNVAEFGAGVYGAEAAARYYFGKPAAGLTEHEAAELAASLPRPASWHPGVASGRYASYVEDILDRMNRAAYLWKYLGEATGDSLAPPDSLISPAFGDSLIAPDSVRF